MVFCLPSRASSSKWLSGDADDADSGELLNEKRAQPCHRPQHHPADGATAADRAAKDEALANLQLLLEDHKIDVYVVPSEDEHLSEYPSPADRRLRFITGFSGSAGTALITRSAASLYVDSRYWVQAPQQVSRSWSVKRVGEGKQRGWADDLIAIAEGVTRVGIDPRLISAAAGGAHSASVGSLLAALNLSVVPIKQNLVDEVWADQPERSSSLVEEHPLKFAGKPSNVKLKELSESPALQQDGVRARGMLITALDEIIWLLNMRGVDDVPMTPVFYAYLWIPLDEDVARASARALFVNPDKISAEVAAYLATLNVQTKPYDEVWSFLEGIKVDLGVSLGNKGPSAKVFTGQAISWAVQLAVGKDNIRSVLSPVTEAKAVKNDVEIEGFRNAYLRDGRATVRWMTQLDKLIRKEGKKVDEHEATVLHTSFRAQEQYYRGPAYGDISGSGPNGALPHYEPVPGSCRTIDRETPYVNDSGSQYADGTIDTTRTMHFGAPSRAQKQAFTRVLQGHLAVIRTVFPSGKAGQDFNTLARFALWQAQLDFGHGVGHGIGSYGGVHEGPEGIANPYPLKPGHVISCEPGYYKEGAWGMRIESAILCVQLGKTSDDKGDWLGWELLTRVPIATNLVDSSLLSPVEHKWLKDHNELCKKALLPLLDGPSDAEARKWLKRQ